MIDDSLGPQGTTGIPGDYAIGMIPKELLLQRTDNPTSYLDVLVNSVIDAAVNRGLLVAGAPVTLNGLVGFVRLLSLKPEPVPPPPPLPDYRFIYNDWRDDRCSLYGPNGPIVSGLAPYQRRNLMDHFINEASFMRQRVFALRRFACFESEDGIYENPLGSFVMFKDLRDLFEPPIVVDMK